MSKSKMIVRTKFIDRACHWTVVICFFLVAVSGISFFFPTLQWLTETFGTPQMGRILHPFFGVLIFVVLMFMFVRFVHHNNIPDRQDIPWLKDAAGAKMPVSGPVPVVGRDDKGFWTVTTDAAVTPWQIGDGSGNPVEATGDEQVELFRSVKAGNGRVEIALTDGGTLSAAQVNDLSVAGTANCYVVGRAAQEYALDATVAGNGVVTDGLREAVQRFEGRSLGTSLAGSHARLLWQSNPYLIEPGSIACEGGMIRFSTTARPVALGGNAVIGLFASDDPGAEALWSWHIWATDYDPDAEGGTVDFNGYTLMNRNLGALANDNSTTDKILASYGLYYQWGRKDPFIGPNTYQGSEGSGASMYSGSGSRVYLKMSESSAETGTMEYAIRNPLVFITGVADTDNDWLWSGRSDQLWSADDNVADKSVNDPCPYGWRVAPSGAFDNLAIVGTPAVGDEAKYGWTLTDGNAESFFIGAGRRRYDNGKILNIYNPLPKVRSDAMEAQPWEGLYWTTAVSRTQAAALHFWFEKLDTSAGIENSVPYARANGLQVRCVKQQGR